MHFTNDPHDVHYKGAKLGHFFKTVFSLSLGRILFLASLSFLWKNAHSSDWSRSCSAHHEDHWFYYGPLIFEKYSKGNGYCITNNNWNFIFFVAICKMKVSSITPTCFQCFFNVFHAFIKHTKVAFFPSQFSLLAPSLLSSILRKKGRITKNQTFYSLLSLITV